MIGRWGYNDLPFPSLPGSTLCAFQIRSDIRKSLLWTLSVPLGAARRATLSTTRLPARYRRCSSLRKNRKGSIQSATRATSRICYTLSDLKESYWSTPDLTGGYTFSSVVASKIWNPDKKLPIQSARRAILSTSQISPEYRL